MNQPPFSLFPQSASTMAPRVDALYWFMVVVSVVMTIAIALALVVLGYRYRRRPGTPSRYMGASAQGKGAVAIELIWIALPFAVMLVMFVWSARLYAAIERPPEGATEIFVTGRQWMWKVQHMNGRREINELHVPTGTPIKLIMTSEDVIHSFYVPAFRVKQDVLPGRYSTMWFEATTPGEYHLFCAEYCGTKHSGMIGRVVVMEPSAFEAWLAGSSGGSMQSSGERLFGELGCVTCHQAGGGGRGPSLNGVFSSKVELANGEEVTADEAYLRQSIVDPAAQVVKGYAPIMPAYQGLVSEEGILSLITYIKSLSPAQPTQAAPLPVKSETGVQEKKP